MINELMLELTCTEERVAGTPHEAKFRMMTSLMTSMVLCFNLRCQEIDKQTAWDELMEAVKIRQEGTQDGR